MTETYDVVVIGGGIIAASAAQHLTAAGYRTLLAERRDYGSGTTSRTSRLQHCGLGYLSAAISRRLKPSGETIPLDYSACPVPDSDLVAEASVIHAVRKEQARTLEDILRRRLTVGWDAGLGLQEAEKRCAHHCAAFGLDDRGPEYAVLSGPPTLTARGRHYDTQSSEYFSNEFPLCPPQLRTFSCRCQ